MRRVILPKLRKPEIQREKHRRFYKTKSKPYTLRRGLAVSVFIFVFVLSCVAWSHDQFINSKNTAFADGDGQNLVSVYYDGQNKTIATNATTVREALSKMGVTLQKGDVVEPSADSAITLGVTNVNVYRALSYEIRDGSKVINTTSGYRSPKKVAEQAGLTVYPEDEIKTERVDEFVQNDSVGQRVVIDRANAVTVILAGKKFVLRSRAATVGELFAEKKLDVRAQDIVQTPLNTKLENGMTIVVNRTGQRVVTQEQSVGFETIQTVDSTKPVGYSEVQDQGSNGTKVLSYLVTEQDGVEVSRQLLEEKITTNAKPRIIIVGPTSAQTDGWAKLRFCESGGNYANKNNPLYRGAYQFSYSTWGNYGGYADPADAPAEVQDAKAMQLFKSRGASPWPVCGRFLR